MNKTVLITGSGGLIGSEAVNHYCEKGFEVVGIDNDMRAYYFGSEGSTKENVIQNINLYKNYKHFEADIRDQAKIEEIFKKFEFDLIIHTAAQPSHDWAAKEPLTDFSVNADGTLLLLENFRKYSPKGVFIFTSTNKVYGDSPNRLPLVEKEKRFEISSSHKYKNGVAEDMPIDDSTHSLFGVSKTAADLMVQEYGRYFHLNTGVFRGGCLTGSKHAGVQQHGFLSYLIKCILTGRKYTIFGYKGKQVRDNIHAHDLINVFDHFFKNPKQGEVYNIGGSRFANISILEAIEKVQKISGRKTNIEYKDQNRTGDHIWYVSDVSKFKKHYPDWSYEYNIDATIEDICRNSSFAKKIFSFHVIKNLQYWREKNWYYYSLLKQIFKDKVEENVKVLQVGYGLGDILASLFPKKGVSVDTDETILDGSKKLFPYLTFLNTKPENINLDEKFDYAIFPNSLDHFEDIQSVLENVKDSLSDDGTLVIASPNPRWEQIFYILEKLNLKRKEPPRNWLRIENIKNLLEISGYEVKEGGFRIFLPLHIPLISRFLNRIFASTPLLSRFCVQQYVVAKKGKSIAEKNLSCSIIIPSLNHPEEIKNCLTLIPQIGKSTEIIIADYGSDNKNISLVKKMIKGYKNVQLILDKREQDAILRGFEKAKGDIVITYDSKMDVPPAELKRAYSLIASDKADFVNATRLIYPLKGQSLRQLNIITNLLFSKFYSLIFGQRVTDMLCSVKAFRKEDYKKLKISGKNLPLDVLMAASKSRLKILELPVHYNSGVYSKTKKDLIRRALFLLKMSFISIWKVRLSPL